MTVNALLPGGPGNTRMIPLEEVPDRSKLVQPEVMMAPIVWLMSAESNGVTGRRFIAKDGIRRCRRPRQPSKPARRRGGRSTHPSRFDGRLTAGGECGALGRALSRTVPQWAPNSNAHEIDLVCKSLLYCDISRAALQFLWARRCRLVAERAKQFGRRAGSLRMRTTSVLRRLRIASGMQAGAISPCRATISNPGRPLSAMVGVSGRAK